MNAIKISNYKSCSANDHLSVIDNSVTHWAKLSMIHHLFT